MKLPVCAIGTILFVGFVNAQSPTGKKGGARGAAAPAAATQPKFKAIWEPVPFGKDIRLNAIACVGPETCWVAGEKSTILHTKDGGKTWQAQIGGDPEGTEEDLREIFFLDPGNGWVMGSRNKLMGTSDGGTWAELGTLLGTSQALRFISPQIGFYAENSNSTTQSTLERSDNGGKAWQPAYRCGVDASIGGLPRKLQCRIYEAQFLSATVGFLGGGAAIDMGTETATFLKTADGAQSWTASVIPDTKDNIENVLFWSEKDGIVVLGSGQVFWTADAGATWTGSVNPPTWGSLWGNGQGKIIVGIPSGGAQAAYSFNGGRNFTSRKLGTPASVRGVTFVDSQNGYLVGDHGMAYRYRIVPIDYNVKGMIGAAAATQ